MPKFERHTHRAREHLIAAGQLYPNAWKQADQFRAERAELGDWPEWCYLPLAAAYAIVSADAGMKRLPPHLAGDVGRLGALCTWRMTQGIYRFDPALYPALTDTPLTGDLPCEALHRLPEWCVYVETPGLEWLGKPLHGAFAHLEWDVNHGREELRLLLDGEAGLHPVPLHLGAWPLAEAVDRMLDTAAVWATAEGLPVKRGGADQLETAVLPILNLLLYLCSDDPDITRRGRPDTPGNPVPKRTRRQGWKLFPADGPREWDAGVRLGSALRRAYQREETGQASPETGRRVRPHVRRAHWHTVLSGKRKRPDGTAIPPTERRRELRWMPPIPVAVEDIDAMPSTIKPVK
ncbi:MAG: hypothetical protein CMI02_14955 [Oceanospirillaceae bacterium]|nr:hypothetical protein [Oceanospirillaceae bacterium]